MDAEASLESLWRDSGDRLLRLAFQLTHDRGTAQDVVQDALIGILRNWRRRPAAVVSPEHYARRAVVNEYLRTQRRLASRELVVAEVPDLRMIDFTSELAERDALWRALGTLSARQRAVMVLRHYEQLPDAQIAEVLGARESTVRSLALRATTTLQASLLTVEGTK